VRSDTSDNFAFRVRPIQARIRILCEKRCRNQVPILKLVYAYAILRGNQSGHGSGRVAFNVQQKHCASRTLIAGAVGGMSENHVSQRMSLLENANLSPGESTLESVGHISYILLRRASVPPSLRGSLMHERRRSDAELARGVRTSLGRAYAKQYLATAAHGLRKARRAQWNLRTPWRCMSNVCIDGRVPQILRHLPISSQKERISDGSGRNPESGPPTQPERTTKNRSKMDPSPPASPPRNGGGGLQIAKSGYRRGVPDVNYKHLTYEPHLLEKQKLPPNLPSI
jgi:hypothetical protein